MDITTLNVNLSFPTNEWEIYDRINLNTEAEYIRLRHVSIYNASTNFDQIINIKTNMIQNPVSSASVNSSTLISIPITTTSTFSESCNLTFQTGGFVEGQVRFEIDPDAHDAGIDISLSFEVKRKNPQ